MELLKTDWRERLLIRGRGRTLGFGWLFSNKVLSNMLLLFPLLKFHSKLGSEILVT